MIIRLSARVQLSSNLDDEVSHMDSAIGVQGSSSTMPLFDRMSATAARAVVIWTIRGLVVDHCNLLICLDVARG